MVMLAAALMAGANARQARSDGPWAYRIGETRVEQQGNFCATEEETLEVAGIFEKFSPLTGYSALANAPGCGTFVRTFTPHKLLKELTLAAGKPEQYKLRFIEVHTVDGGKLYLVTTRRLEQ